MGRASVSADWPLSRRGGSAAGSGPQAAPAKAGPGREAAGRLDSQGDNVVGSSDGNPSAVQCGEMVISRCGCGRRLCPSCGAKLGKRLRARLHAKAALFVVPRMLSLTVDLKGTGTGVGFDSPGAALEHVRRRRLISHLMRRLGITRWVWVLEFQPGTSAPHWHILVDVSGLPNHEVDYKRAWYWWREVWKIGGFDGPSRRAVRMRDTAHAINYITKYLIKSPRDGFPEWVYGWDWKSQGSIRFCGASREVGRLVDEDSEPEAVECAAEVEADEECEVEQTDTAPVVEHQTYREAVDACGSVCSVWVTEERPDDRRRFTWVGSLTVCWERLVAFAAAGQIRGITWRVAPRADGRGGVDDGRLEMVFEGEVRDLQRQIEEVCAGDLRRAVKLAEKRGFRFFEEGGVLGWRWSSPEAVA